MLQLMIIRDKQKRYIGFVLQGHASDSLTCAGVSAVAQTAVIGLLHYAKRARYCVDKGITAIVVDTLNRECRAILETAIQGIMAAADSGHNTMSIVYGTKEQLSFDVVHTAGMSL